MEQKVRDHRERCDWIVQMVHMFRQALHEAIYVAVSSSNKIWSKLVCTEWEKRALKKSSDPSHRSTQGPLVHWRDGESFWILKEVLRRKKSSRGECVRVFACMCVSESGFNRMMILVAAVCGVVELQCWLVFLLLWRLLFTFVVKVAPLNLFWVRSASSGGCS